MMNTQIHQPRGSCSAAALDALLLHRQLVQGLPQTIDGLRQAMLEDLVSEGLVSLEMGGKSMENG